MSLCLGPPGAAPLFVFDDRTRALRPLHWAGSSIACTRLISLLRLIVV